MMINLLNLPAEFDYNLLLDVLKDYKKPRDKIRGLIKNQEIIRIKKGLYVLGKQYNKPYNRYILANQIYGPSYVSAQSALSYWQLIPERVELMISITPKRNKKYETPAGNYYYKFCPLPIYKIGICIENINDNKTIFIASPEKALSDIVASEKKIKNINDIESYLTELRLDESFLKRINFRLLDNIMNLYKKCNLDLLNIYLKKKSV